MGAVKMIQLMKLIIFSCLFFTGFIVTSGEKSDLCANDWVDATYFGLGCLWTNHTMAGEMTQEEAYAYCYNLDPRAKLLEIYDENDLMFLTALLNEEFPDPINFNANFWLGGTDLGHEGTWIWISSMQPVEDFVWYKDALGEPHESVNDNCMAWYRNLGFDKARNYPCSDSHYPLCQILV